MAWNAEPIKRLFKNMVGSPTETQTRDVRFRDEALPHLPAVSRYALSLTRDEADADDLVQETFLRAFRSWNQFERGTECRAWLFTICRNTYVRTARRAQWVEAHPDADLESLAAAAVHSAAQGSGIEDVFTRQEVVSAVRRAVDELPDPFREVVVLVDLQEESYEEAARILEIPKGTVRSRLFRGRRLLQERLIEHARDAGIVGSRHDRAAGQENT
jgi:RNA polymerase sigma-70 factor (ECF subfamily)